MILNNIESIDFSTYPLLPKLERILLEGHILKDDIIPGRFFEMPNLKQLNITHAAATSLPEIPDNCSLECLNLYKNSIRGFPTSILKCSNLKFLDLARNNIGIIPGDISKLENLEYLYVGVNNLTSLSEKIFSLKLKEFDLDGNPNLTTKIYNFGKLKGFNVLAM